jgi:transcriptional regulator with XRE-family HTH domain
MARRASTTPRAKGTKELAKMIRGYREYKGITAQEFATRIGSSRQFVTNLETKIVAITNEQTIEAVANETGLHPYELYAAGNYPPHDLVRIISTLTSKQMLDVRHYAMSFAA